MSTLNCLSSEHVAGLRAKLQDPNELVRKAAAKVLDRELPYGDHIPLGCNDEEEM